MRLPTPIRFLKSALADDSQVTPNPVLNSWIEAQHANADMRVELVPFAALGEWQFVADGRLAHRSGRFFSIDGIEVGTDWGLVPNWDQPIINQPEIGFLGILAREFGGILHFLMQAKIEPGNINAVQISPTLQATKSNYTRVHGGASPPYLEHFLAATPEQVLVDQLQSEQGARFLSKRNRNIIIEAGEDVPVQDGFCWMTLGQIKTLLRQPNVINMDTRTVISGISYGEYDEGAQTYFQLFAELFPPKSANAFELLHSFLHSGESYYSIEQLISWITHLRSRYELHVAPRPLPRLQQWIVADDEIYHETRKYFRVVGAQVEIAGREVKRWSQPLIETAQEGLIAFVIKRIGGVFHFLVQAKLEPGNFDIIEFAPTVQCLTGDYRGVPAHLRPAYLDYVLAARPEQVIFDAFQSEEGGRFFREQNRNLLVVADEDFPLECGENYRWMTLNQIKQFIRFNNYLNVQARSLLSAISFC